MTTTEKKAAIQSKLKEAGYNSRKVSASIRRGGYDSVIILQIRDAGVDPKAIKEITDGFASVSRCEVTGEILGGGNVFVWIKGTNGRIF